MFVLVVTIEQNSSAGKPGPNGTTMPKMVDKKIVVTKTMKVYRVKTGNSWIKEPLLLGWKVKKKALVIYRSQWLISTGSGWVIKSNKYKGWQTEKFRLSPEKDQVFYTFTRLSRRNL